MANEKLVSSPIIYPGGKSRAVKQILEILPKDIKSLCSPFMGGGSIELACASLLGIPVFGYDSFAPVVNFWQEAIKESEAVADIAREYNPLERAEYYELKKAYFLMKDKQRMAAAFFVINRCSFSGMTFSGGFSLGHRRFTEKIITERLEYFKVKGLSVALADFKDSIPKHPDSFLYLDPPYAIREDRLYGVKGNTHEGFDHEGLATILKGRGRWLLSYSDCERVRDLYAGFKMETAEWAWSMSAKKGKYKKSNELLISSGD